MIEFVYRCGFPTVKQIWFRVDTNLDHFNLPEDILRTDTETNQKWITLFVQPNNYRIIKEGEGFEYIDADVGVVNQVSTVRKGFRVTMQYPQFKVVQALTALAYHGIKNKQTILCVDFVKPEFVDYEKGYTEREGNIFTSIESMGTIQKQFPQRAYNIPEQTYLDSEWSFTFKEAKRRWI